MKRPISIKIGPHVVPVTYVKTMDEAGQYMATPNPSIQINDRIKDGGLVLTLWHETCHAGLDLYGIDFDKPPDEERVVRFMETVLPQLIRENKIFRDWI